jgi:signal transduction histidine kinase
MIGVPEAPNIRSDSLLHTIVDTIADSVVVVTRDGIIRYVNRAAETLFERAAGDLVGSEFGYSLQDSEIPLPGGQGEPGCTILDHLGSGLYRLAEMRVAQLEWQGQPAHVAIIRDISRRERLHAIERALLVANRRAAIAQLLSSVAHEINTPTAVIMTNLTVMKDILQDFENAFAEARISRKLLDKYQILQCFDDMREMLADNSQGLDRIRSFMREFKALCQPGRDVIDVIDVNEVVALSCDLFAHRDRQGIRLVRELGELPKIAANGLALMQIVAILLDNAARAIAVASEQGAVQPGAIHVITCCDADAITVGIRDTGCGIAKEHVDTIFETLFMTGKKRRLMGIGLAIAHEIASSHGGRLEVTSQLGQGSEFRLIVPLDTGLAPGQSSDPS